MSDILTERLGSILRIQLNRPARKNAMTSDMYVTLADLFNAAAKDDEIRVVLWHGAGDSFCAGNDIEDFLKHPPGPGDSPQDRLMNAFMDFDKPLIAAVHGAAIGGGTTMLTHCDFVYAAEKTKFQMPFIDLALVPEFGSSFSIPARIGHIRAAELILLALPFDATQAADLGLVTQVVSEQNLLSTATETAHRLAAKSIAALQALQTTHEAVMARATRVGDHRRKSRVQFEGSLRGRAGGAECVLGEASSNLRSSHETRQRRLNAVRQLALSQVKAGRTMISITSAPESAPSPKTPLRNAVGIASDPRTIQSHVPGPGTVRRIVSTRLPTKWGEFQVLGFEREVYNAFGTGRVETALALVMGDVNDVVTAPLVRIHSQCFTSESLGSLRCDCKEQLDIAMKAIAAEGRGLVIYENQEGRGIGLMAKLQAYALQDAGLDTIDANRALGLESDYRDFILPAAILHHLCIDRVRLLTNNSQKSCALIKAGIAVVAQIPCESTPNPHSLAYLRAKKERMQHALSLGGMETPHNGTEYARDERAAEGDEGFEFASIERAIEELRAGRMIVVVDDEDRENEGDLTMLADMVTPEAINFMATHGRGLICLAMTGERLDELELAAMTADDANSALHGTAFTVSIDAKGQDVTTGISAHDRAYTISAAINKNSCTEDFARPGHVFPLRARSGGVLERRGQTEAAVDLARLAGMGEHPAGVICEIINDDGTMARVPDLSRFCKKHDLLMITVEALAQYRSELADEESFVMFTRCFSKCA